VAGTAVRPGSVLNYVSASATPVVGTIVQGGTSGAVGRVVAQSGAATGTITLRDIDGAFINGEALTFSDAKTATTSSTLIPAVAIYDAGLVVKRAPLQQSDADWDYTINVSGNSMIVQVKGDTGKIVEWIVEVDILRP
jgi:hypothetical protein